MPRPDLLALTPDDLAALTNRGLVKRAQKDLEAGTLSAQWEESGDGTIRAMWSDGVASTLPGGKTLKEADCTCGALELCRHILRTVLAWQARQSTPGSDGTPPPPAPWDPGRISDALLESQTPRAVRDRAAALWAQGVLAELLRGVKPSASFHHPGHTVRFPVPDDLRYARCSCADDAPCVHAVLAVRAFRQLAPEATSGIVSEGPLDAPVPPEVLIDAGRCVETLLLDGLASLGPAWRDRARRIAAECLAATLTWPAQILEELAGDFEHYTTRDAVFSPGQTVARAGELLLRLDAIRTGVAPVPPAFVRGMKSDRDSELGAGRFVGLGASVVETRRGCTLTVFLQDRDSGHALTLAREFTPDPDPAAAPKPYAQLARATAAKDATLAALAGGQLITQGGKRTASGRLVIGRARAAVNPQNYAWEQLKAPVLAEDFAEIQARLRLLPPASFRPRRAAADFHVCPLSGVEHASFDPVSNAVVAVLRDPSGETATLSHPWTTRGQSGAEALLAALVSGDKPFFVAGHVRTGGGHLVIHPTAFVIAGDGNTRRCVLPWIQASPLAAGSGLPRHPPGSTGGPPFPYAAAAELAAELVLNGTRRTAARQWPGWERAIIETEECGLHKMAAVLHRVRSAAGDAGAALALLKALTLARDAGVQSAAGSLTP